MRCTALYVDLSRLSEKGVKWAVHCPTEESAEAFMEAMRQQYPKHVELWMDTTRWDTYWGDTVYSPDINGACEDNRVTYSDLEFFMDPRHGFTVVSFDSLCVSSEDLPEFDVSDVDSLLSMLE